MMINSVQTLITYFTSFPAQADGCCQQRRILKCRSEYHPNKGDQGPAFEDQLGSYVDSKGLEREGKPKVLCKATRPVRKAFETKLVRTTVVLDSLSVRLVQYTMAIFPHVTKSPSLVHHCDTLLYSSHLEKLRRHGP